MRSIAQGTALVLAALLTACATDTIEGPTSSAAPPALTKGASLDATFTYATVDVPNSTNTTAWGINPGGDIVGSYTDATGLHGFLLHDGAYTSINYPGAARTQARGIGPAGDIVGNYSRRGEVGVSTHGFLLTRDGEFRPIDYDPHPNTIAQRILPDGTLLGCLHDGDTMDSMHGIAIGRGGRSELAQPATMNNGGTPNGRRLTGLFTDTDNRTLALGQGNRRELDRLTLGLNFRPIEDTVFKFDWQFNTQNNAKGLVNGGDLGVANSPLNGNGFLVQMATYF